MSESVVGKTDLKRHEAAKPVHIQRLEAALDVRPFVAQVERLLHSNGESDSEDDSDDKSISNEMLKGDRIVLGTTIEERARLYNLGGVRGERAWLRDVLLCRDSSSDEEPAERVRRLLRARARTRRRAAAFHRDPARARYMYYGAGLLSTVDRYPERAAAGARAARAPPRRRARAEPDWEEPPAERPAAAARGRRKAGPPRSAEAWRARRRRHWLLLVKKELGKVGRARGAAHRELAAQRRRLAALACRHWRHAATQSQRNMKETVWRCKRLSREMQAYWRRYDRAEREARRRLEREAEEQRKMDVELMEAKRQRRKLNFLITQTELYAHFMQRKRGEGDAGAAGILAHLDDDDCDSEALKALARRNAREAVRAERARAQAFDAAAGAPPRAPAPAADCAQPSIFRGTLKGYQLKGMNWLADLYDQGISGILADEMGLGKTVQCIAFLCHVAERLGVWGPFLVVSPASTLHNWQQECQRFVPDFKVVPYWGSPSERRILRQFWERRDLHTRAAAFHVVVTSYQIVVSDCKYLNRVPWQHMILDEAQAIKSAASARWRLLLGFSCRNRLLLSGTPIQNSMAELWALLHFIMPTLFDSHDEFNEWFSKDIESHAEHKTAIDEKHLSRLHMILKPFMLRRIKKDVENELSDKIEVLVHCPLTARQKLLYMALKKKIKIEELLHYTAASAEPGLDRSFTSNLMNLVMQFRKVCNHPELFERRSVRAPLAAAALDVRLPALLAPPLRPRAPAALAALPAAARAAVLAAGALAGPLRPARAAAASAWILALQLAEEDEARARLLRHRRAWGPAGGAARGGAAERLLLCPAGDTLRCRADDSPLWRDLLFTHTLGGEGPFHSHETHRLHFVTETAEHRALRLARAPDPAAPGPPSPGPAAPGPAAPPRTPRDLPMQRTALPTFLYTAQEKVVSRPPVVWASSRAFAHAQERRARAAAAAGAAARARVPDQLPRPPAMLQVPDKNQLVSDAGKLTVLDSLLKRLKERGHRVLIYSQMTKMIDLLEEYMWHRKHKYMRLDGSSKISARRDMVADFQARADIFVFLLSTRAGGLGINLTAADTVIFYDSDWNPTVDQQAMDRAHRLGQTKQVTVYRLICQGTIEERIMQRAREKSEIQRMVISGGNFKPDTLKPKEVVSLLLDDDEIELKYRQKSEEKKIIEERERKRKPGPAAPGEAGPEAAAEEAGVDEAGADEAGGGKRARDSGSEPASPPHSPHPHLFPSAGAARGARGRGARRGRPRGPRAAAPRRADLAPATDPAPGGAGGAGCAEPAPEPGAGARARRGPGRPRLRAGAPPAPRRPRRAREPLLVPLAPPP